MKRYTLAGAFAGLAGAAGLLLLVSIVYSCGMGGSPHESRYNSERIQQNTNESHTAVTTMPVPKTASAPTGLTIHSF